MALGACCPEGRAGLVTITVGMLSVHPPSVQLKLN